jgi:predicted GNAT family acetyltransferase
MTEIRILQPGDQAALEAFVLPRIASSMFLVGNSRAVGLIDRGEVLHGTYAAAFEHGAIVAVAAHCWNGNVVVQAPEHALALCRAAVRASGRPLAALLGPDAQVAGLITELGIAPAQLQLDSSDVLFELALSALQAPPLLASGTLRVRHAGRDDIELLARWYAAYSIEILNAADGPELNAGAQHAVERWVERRQGWLARLADGTPVAMTAFNAAIAEAVQVGGVYTPPALRSRGYARAAVAQSLIDARDAGVQTALLFTGDDNPAAQRAYGALGFTRVGDYRLSMLHDPLPAAAVTGA